MANQGSPAQVKCASCSTVLRFVPAAAETLLTCPKCNRQMKVKTPQAAQPAAQRPVAPQPAPQQAMPQQPIPTAGSAQPGGFAGSAQPAGFAGSAQSPFDQLPAAASQPGGGFPSFPAAPAGQQDPFASVPTMPAGGPGQLPAQPAYRMPPPGPGMPGGPQKKKKRKSGGKAGKTLLKIGAIVGGGGFALILVVIGIGLALTSIPESTVTIAQDGFTVQAKGKKMPTQTRGMLTGQTIYSRKTNSEYMIASQSLFVGGRSVSAEQVKQGLMMRGSSTVTDIQRAGLTGWKFRMTDHRGIEGQCELFTTPANKALMVIYIPGTEREAAGMGKALVSDAQVEKIDNPEAFFASLKKQ